jgi:uncharacterized protein (DUF1015 family)
MARLEAFRGTTYDPDRVNADDVIAPPYDVVGPPERATLAARSPYNAIHVELPVAPEGSREDKYHHAAAVFEGWHRDGIVTVAEEATIYVYRMGFGDEDGSTRTTTGVFGALGLDPGHTGEVLPHEQTISKDKHDRLSLLRAASTNFSPIWGLSIAEGFTDAVEAALALAQPGPWRALDGSGVLHEIWAVTDAGAIARLTAVAATAPVLIADGHHRYETACAYHEELPDQPGSDAVLAFVVELAEEELAVRAIHRLLLGVDPERLPNELGAWFELEPGPSDPIELRDAMTAKGTLGLLTRGGAWLLQPLPRLLDAAQDELDTTRLAVALADLGHVEVVYQPGAVEARRAVDQALAEAAVLVRPVSIAQIARTAHGGRRMAPKSTFFHPKPRTGMVFRELAPDSR